MCTKSTRQTLGEKLNYVLEYLDNVADKLDIAEVRTDLEEIKVLLSEVESKLEEGYIFILKEQEREDKRLRELEDKLR